MDHLDPTKVPTMVAGGAGAFLSILFQRDASKLTMFTTLATAEIGTYYLAKPLWLVLHDNFKWVDDQWQGPVALTIGLLAIFVVGGVVKMAQDFWSSPWQTIGDFFVSILQRFFPGKKDK